MLDWLDNMCFRLRTNLRKTLINVLNLEGVGEVEGLHLVHHLLHIIFSYLSNCCPFPQNYCIVFQITFFILNICLIFSAMLGRKKNRKYRP